MNDNTYTIWRTWAKDNGYLSLTQPGIINEMMKEFSDYLEEIPEGEVRYLPKAVYMIATTAMHKLGDISRPGGDLCVVFKEDDENYIGNWVTGYGFVEVKFPKVSTRKLTNDEILKYRDTGVQIGSSLLTPLRVDND